MILSLKYSIYLNRLLQEKIILVFGLPIDRNRMYI